MFKPKLCPICNSDQISSYLWFDDCNNLHCTCQQCHYEYVIDESGSIYRYPFGRQRLKVKLFIIRGVPGTGKSTHAQKIKEIIPDSVIFEADQYFINKNGEYNFNPKKLHQAHEWCIWRCDNALRLGLTAIVSNTFIKKKDMNPYFEMCKKYGLDYLVIPLFKEYGSIHNVPEKTMERMRRQFQI